MKNKTENLEELVQMLYQMHLEDTKKINLIYAHIKKINNKLNNLPNLWIKRIRKLEKFQREVERVYPFGEHGKLDLISAEEFLKERG